jgi:aminoglycoside phosphotransferase (APT) family kinase protein
VRELSARLLADVPLESAAGIVHGDFRLDNVLVDSGDRLTAVLDWELATLGDPLTDLALMLIYGRVGELSGSHEIFNASCAPGYLSEQNTLERYAVGTDRQLDRFGFYLGLASFKIAGILQGIHFRYVHGQAVGEGFAGVGALVEPVLEGGLDAMKEYT